MDNNDILRRLRYALDIRDIDMIEIFKLGGLKVTREELLKVLHNPQKDRDGKTGIATPNAEAIPYVKECSNHMLESFLNGFIIFKRGKQDNKSDGSEKNDFLITNNKSVNNVMLKKLKIALTLTSEDILDIFKSAGINLSNGELSALLRREGHRNYKPCGDRYARNFLKGLTEKYRK